jgi:hypothetical protein
MTINQQSRSSITAINKRRTAMKKIKVLLISLSLVAAMVLAVPTVTLAEEGGPQGGTKSTTTTPPPPAQSSTSLLILAYYLFGV